MSNLTDEQFIRLFLPHAVEAEKRSGIPRFYLLAMHLTEQGRNSNPPGNMCFGIKADAKWKGKRQLLKTWEVFKTATVKWPHKVISIKPLPDGRFRYDLYAEFRAYDSIADCYVDHAAFLKANSRYKAAWQHTNSDVEFTRAVVAGGYATDPAKLSKMLTAIAFLKKKSAPSATSASPEKKVSVPVASSLSAPSPGGSASGADSKPGAELPGWRAPGRLE